MVLPKIVLPLLTTLILLALFERSLAQAIFHADIIVDQSGKGDYRTITAAIAALPMYTYQRTIIFIKNGVYNEKLRLEQNYITLRGESRDSTIIRYSQLREDWNKNKDYLGPGVINIDGDDIVLDNLTIENGQPEIGPHAFAIYGLTCNRIVITNCNVISKGGDTVSLWNYKDGMYYHANCYFEGAVDFVCPRGWCFIRDSKFYEVKETAALWHAGSYDSEQKFVIRNSDFEGVPGFQLGRHHYEAQFYLIDCRFPKNMADRSIYHVMSDDPDKNNPYYSGDRKHFYNCTKSGEAFDWYKNNLDRASGSLSPEEITPAWTFGGEWDPEDTQPVRVTDYTIAENSVTLAFSEIVTVRGKPVFKNKAGKEFRIVMQRFTDINQLTFVADSQITKEDLADELFLQDGGIVNSIASVQERSVGSTFRLP